MCKRITGQDQIRTHVILRTLCVPSERSWLFYVLYPCSQVASEKAELLAALIEYEKDINLLESLYNNNKALLDRHELDTDLKELAEYVLFLLPVRGSQTGLTRRRRILRDLDEWLNSANPNLGKRKKLLGVKELWKAGDLREKLTTSNAKISSVRARWQVCGGGIRRRTVLIAITVRRDCNSAHSYRQTLSLDDWTLFRSKWQRSSNRCSPCSSRGRSGHALVVSQCTRKSNRPASIARQQGYVTIYAYKYILIGIILRSWPIHPRPLSPSPYYPLTPLFHMIVSSFA